MEPQIKSNLNKIETKIKFIKIKKTETIEKKLNKLNSNNVNNTNNNIEKHHKFHPRLINLTNVKFNNEETQLLNNITKTNLEQNLKPNLDNLIVETEYAISLLKDENQEEKIRTEAAHTIKKLITTNKYTQCNKVKNTIKNIRTKISTNNLTVTKADKSNAIVILKQSEYNKKTEEFIDNNNCIILKKDPTEKYLRETIKLVKTAKDIFDNKNLDVYINHNPNLPK